MHLRRVAALALVWVLLLLSFGARAQPAPAGEEMILSIVTNGVSRGEFTLVRTGEDFWVAAKDVQRLGVKPKDVPTREFDGIAYLPALALGATRVKFDEATLTLAIDFPVTAIPATRIDLTAPPAPLGRIEPQTSFIAGYRLFSRRAGAGGGSREGLETDLNLRYGSLLLHQASRLQIGDVPRDFVRGTSQVMWDDLDRGARLTVGDVLTSAGAYGSTLVGGGILYARHFELTPDLIRQPAASMQASTSLPAEVEVSVDGNVITRQRVGPGPIIVDNLLQYGGTRQVRVTVTDISGHREVYDQPFLFTDQVLARGVHDFSYFIGKRADPDAEGQAHYRENAWQAYHRYGLTDSLTISGGGEGNRDFTNLGAGATWRSDRLGLFAGDLLSSTDHVSGQRGTGWAARYAYLLPESSLLLSRREFAHSFRSFSTTGPSVFPRRETRAGLTTRLFGATFGVELLRSTSDLERRSSGTVRLTKNLSRRAFLTAELQVARVNGVTQRLANVFLRFDLDSERWVSSAIHSSDTGRQLELETGRTLMEGEGLGYRVGTLTATGDGPSTTTGYASATWNLRPATVEFYGTAPLTGADRNAYYAEAAVSGAFVSAGGFYGITRRVDDSFLVARLGVRQPGIDVLVNNQVQGRTDSNGMLFLPEIASYSRQDISVNDKQVGIQYSLGQDRRTVTLPYRSGAVIDFRAHKVHSVTGLVHLVDAGVRRIPPASTLTLEGPGVRRQLETSSEGDFYIEDAPSGDYTGPLQVNGKVYACHMHVPPFDEPVHEIAEGIVCE